MVITKEPVQTGGWYEHTDGTVGEYQWRNAQATLVRTVASWADVPDRDFDSVSKAERAAKERVTPNFSTAALENLNGYVPVERERMIAADLADLRNGRRTPTELLERCLDGAEPEWVEGWRDYVSALVEVTH